MRVPPSAEVPSEPERRSLAPRVWLVGVLFVLVLLLVSVQGLARVYTDFLWFDALGFGSVWSGLISARFIPALVFTGIFFVVLLINLVLADRLGARHQTYGPSDEVVERYQMLTAPYAGRIRVGVALLFALVMGAGVAGRWQTWLLYRNRVPFGVDDPQFGKDVGFYVFELPFIRMVLDWLFVGLVVVLLLTTLAHYLNGGIRVQTPFQRVAPQVKAHLSVLLALLALTKAAQYWFSRFELVFSTRGPVDGASYTDIKAQLPAYHFLILISITAAVLFIVNIWRRGWTLPVIAVGLWAFISVVVGTALPWYVQRFQVQANQASKEAPYIARNIEATRAAYGLDKVVERPFAYQDKVSAGTLAKNRASLENARLWDPAPLRQILEQNQTSKAYYRFDDLDVDRYAVGANQQQPVLIATRDLDRDEIPNATWVNQHLAYTHGYGAVVTAANQATKDQDPFFLLEGIPPKASGGLDLEQPAVYYGDGLSGFTVVDTKEAEIQPGAGGEEAEYRYDGTGGVQLSSTLRKAALALRFGDWNLFISGRITDESRVLYLRDVRERVATAAPFLSFDSDPYPVLIDGKISWIVDGYTTTMRYPYSQRVDGFGGLPAQFNYIRNSVKAVVDAYDGTVTFYVVDDTDPMIQVYRNAFPSMFTDGSEAPAEIQAHYRYPEEMFIVQSDQWSRYHVTDPNAFFTGEERWSVASEPSAALPSPTTSTTQVVRGNDGGRATNQADTGIPLDPLYLTMALPGEDEQEFVLTRPYSPFRKNQQLSSFLVARMDGDNYGELVTYSVGENVLAPSPAQVSVAIETNTEISSTLSLLRQRGSDVVEGNIQLIPITSGDESTVVYVQPIYVTESRSATPRLRFVAVYGNDGASLGESLGDALEQRFGLAAPGGEPDDGEGEEPGDTPDDALTVEELIARARAEEEKADEVLKAEGLDGREEAQRYLDRALDYYRQAADLLEAQASGDEAAGAGGTDAADEPPDEPTDEPTDTAPSTTTTTAPSA